MKTAERCFPCGAASYVEQGSHRFLGVNEQYFPSVLFRMLYKVVLTFKSVDKILQYEIKATEKYFPVEQGSYSF